MDLWARTIEFIHPNLWTWFTKWVNQKWNEWAYLSKLVNFDWYQIFKLHTSVWFSGIWTMFGSMYRLLEDWYAPYGNHKDWYIESQWLDKASTMPLLLSLLRLRNYMIFNPTVCIVIILASRKVPLQWNALNYNTF